jgi:hypothetical protein
VFSLGLSTDATKFNALGNSHLRYFVETIGEREGGGGEGREGGREAGKGGERENEKEKERERERERNAP